MQVIKLNGDHLTFKGRVYGSVGIEYRIEYDKTAFRMEYNFTLTGENGASPNTSMQAGPA